MSSNQEHIQQLQEIRSLMERSTKFISLSGLSGICAGLIALIGAGVQYWYMAYSGYKYRMLDFNNDFILFTIINFAIVLSAALISAYLFTFKKAKKQKAPLWDKSSKRLIINLAIPLTTGGMFCLVLLHYELIGLIAPATLIFYGLALINGSNFTLDDIRYLGIIEIILGFISCFLIGYGLLFWAIGFGVMHIIYGAVMYFKYDKVTA